MTTTDTVTAGRWDAVATRRGGGLSGAVQSEWVKLRSVRSTWWCLALTAVTLSAHAFPYAASYAVPGRTVAIGEPGLFGATLAQVPIIALAMLAVTAEYGSKSIEATLRWVPVRRRVVLAKAIVVVGTAFVAGVISGALAAGAAYFGAGVQAEVVPAELAVDVGTAAIYFAGVAALTVGVGFLLRSTVWTFGIVVAVTLILPGLLVGSGNDLLRSLGEISPGAAGSVFLHESANDPYSAAVGAAVLAAWAIGSLTLGAALLARRDA